MKESEKSTAEQMKII